MDYPFSDVEPKWRAIWARSGAHHPDLSAAKKKFYGLVMFSYPSAKKLHIGHWYNFGPADTYFRWKRMQGYTVFEPMGYDAFGLPAENYAVSRGVHPGVTTAESITFIREQLEMIGAMYDWGRVVDTSSPNYYKWTQWLFLTLFKQGLAYQKQAPVNWCSSCQTVLANEQAEGGTCERCGTTVVKRDMKQWFFRITRYAACWKASIALTGRARPKSCRRTGSGAAKAPRFRSGLRGKTPPVAASKSSPLGPTRSTASPTWSSRRNIR
jgi:leucyl-tRNA synthetase